MNMDSPFPGLSLIKDNQVKRKTDSAKEIQVFGVGEIILFPDICKIQISVSSVKDDAPTAKNSVIRRLEYILQSAYNHRVKDSNLKVSKTLTRVKDQYRYAATVIVSSTEFHEVEDLCNLLTEKLDSSVVIGDAHLSHSQEHMERARRNAADFALTNARIKAADMARQFSMTLGPPLLIHEDTAEETTFHKVDEANEESRGVNENSIFYCWCGDPESKSIIVRAKVSATFELRKASKFEKN